MIENYKIIISLSGVLGIIARYNLVHIFCDNQVKVEQSKFKVYIFGLFYIVSNSLYIIFDRPIVNLSVQILFLFCICLFMGFRVKKTFLAVSFIIITLVSVESAVIFATGYVSKSIIFEAYYTSIYGVVASNIAIYAISMAIRKYKNIKKNIEIPLEYWGVIFIFPIMSLGLLLIIFRFSVYNPALISIGTIMILIMNLMIFSLYDKLIGVYENKTKGIVTQQMTIRYKKQLELMKGSLVQIKSFQHDVNKHISMMDTLIVEKRYKELEQYMDTIKRNNSRENMISNTGNIVIDSIINFEFNHSDLDQNNMRLTAINIPLLINIEDFDMTVILSNILENALTAANKVEKGQVKINLNFKKGIFFISIENDFDGALFYEGGEYQTTHKEKENHGFGLKNVYNVIEKYNGEINIDHIGKKFRVEIVIYTEPS